MLRFASILFAFALAASAAHAEDRALLIGVGQYRSENIHLPGIDIDIGAMKEVATGLGFRPDAVKVLTHQDATLANVRAALQQWLVEGTAPTDRVLLYYSGHGTQLPDTDGDEADGLDEALTLHDMARVQRGGKTTLDGVLLDDELAEWLARIPSGQVLMLIDACHSGTATRAMPGLADAVPKFYRDPLVMAGGTRGVAAGPDAKRDVQSDNYIALSAAADREQSLATPRGSLFTLAVRDAVLAARRSGQVSVRELWRKATAAIAAQLNDPWRFHPQLSGNLAMADRPVRLADAGSPSVWRRIEALAAGTSGVRVRFDRVVYQEGERMVLEVQLDRPGHLNVVSVGPDGQAVLLFPNGQHPDNRVAAGRLRLPTPAMKFDFRAARPYGPTLVAAFVTDAPLDLYRLVQTPREVLAPLSEAGLQALAAQAAGDGLRAGRSTASVCSASGVCD